MGSGESSFRTPAGYRVINVIRGSPARRTPFGYLMQRDVLLFSDVAGLEMCFDYIVEVDGQTLVASLVDFPALLVSCENRAVKFVVFNARSRTFRDVWITPRRWNPERPGLLGASVGYTPNVLKPPPAVRVLDVFPNSPASAAGLQPLRDYLLGTETTDFSTADDVVGAVAAYQRSGKTDGMQLFVYNSKTETPRVVTLLPSSTWGGAGCLGCDIGEGLLHRIPPPTTAPRNAYTRYLHPGDGTTDEIYIEAQPAKTAGASATTTVPSTSALSPRTTEDKAPEARSMFDVNSQALSGVAATTASQETVSDPPRPGVVYLLQ